MPYANTGGGTTQSLTPAQTAGKKRKDAARLIQKAVPYMNLKQVKVPTNRNGKMKGTNNVA
jgi:hypothetical protein